MNIVEQSHHYAFDIDLLRSLPVAGFIPTSKENVSKRKVMAFEWSYEHRSFMEAKTMSWIYTDVYLSNAYIVGKCIFDPRNPEARWNEINQDGIVCVDRSTILLDEEVGMEYLKNYPEFFL